MRSNSASLTSSIGRLRCVVPALLTMTSMRPKAPVARWTSAATSPSTATSPAQKIALPPLPTIAAATRSPPAGLMSLTTTVAPSCAKRSAIPSPNPEAAPVTTASLPASLMGLSSRRLELVRERVLVGARDVAQAVAHRPQAHLVVKRHDRGIVDREFGGPLQERLALRVVDAHERVFEQQINLRVRIVAAVGGAEALFLAR